MEKRVNHHFNTEWVIDSIHARFLFSFFLFFFLLFGAKPTTAYGNSQARDQNRAVTASLHRSHSHINSGSETSLCPTPQLMATLDPPLTSEARD